MSIQQDEIIFSELNDYTPEEIGGFLPIGTYSDGSPRYYGDKEEE